MKGHEAIDYSPYAARFSFHLPPEMLDLIKRQARVEQLTASAYVRRMLKKALPMTDTEFKGNAE